jgi:hypothetical protein
VAIVHLHVPGVAELGLFAPVPNKGRRKFGTRDLTQRPPLQ